MSFLIWQYDPLPKISVLSTNFLWLIFSSHCEIYLQIVVQGHSGFFSSSFFEAELKNCLNWIFYPDLWMTYFLTTVTHTHHMVQPTFWAERRWMLAQRTHTCSELQVQSAFKSGKTDCKRGWAFHWHWLFQCLTHCLLIITRTFLHPF